MLGPSWLRRQLSFIFLVMSCLKCSFATPDACGVRRAITSVVVVKQTIHILANIPYDTVLNINNDLTVTVDDAPTEFNLITTFYSRSTNIQTIGE